MGETRPPSFHGGPVSRLDAADTADSIIREFDDTESSITSVSQIGRRRHGNGRMPLHGTRTQQLRAGEWYGDASSVLSSEIETSSFFDTEDNESMASSRFTTSTEATSVSRQHANRVRKQKRLRHRKVNLIFHQLYKILVLATFCLFERLQFYEYVRLKNYEI